jgi:hypothetical protein
MVIELRLGIRQGLLDVIELEDGRRGSGFVSSGRRLGEVVEMMGAYADAVGDGQDRDSKWFLGTMHRIRRVSPLKFVAKLSLEPNTFS